VRRRFSPVPDGNPLSSSIEKPNRHAARRPTQRPTAALDRLEAERETRLQAAHYRSRVGVVADEQPAGFIDSVHGADAPGEGRNIVEKSQHCGLVRERDVGTQEVRIAKRLDGPRKLLGGHLLAVYSMRIPSASAAD